MAALLKKVPVLVELAKPKLNVFLKYAKVRELKMRNQNNNKISTVGGYNVTFFKFVFI